MKSDDGVKRLGDKELEYLILRYISEHDGAKESEITKAIPGRTLRVAHCLKTYVGSGVLEMRYSDRSYTAKHYSLTDLGRLHLYLKRIDCSTMHENFKIVECEELDFDGVDLLAITELLANLGKRKPKRSAVKKKVERDDSC